MSLNEDDLRAALHEGDSSGLDVDQLILRGRARVAQRRVHLLSGAAITVLVAAIGVGGAFLVKSAGGESGGSNSANAAAGDRSAPNPHAAARPSGAHGGAMGAPAGGTLSEASKADVAVRCPESMPHNLLPGGGSPGQFGAGGPLFSKPVASVVVCAYGAETKPLVIGGGATYPARLVLRDGAAKSLVTSLESAPKKPASRLCPYIQSSAGTRDYAFIGITADRRRAGTVTTEISTPGCGAQVTNGTAVRYGWTPPPDIAKRLLALAPDNAVPKSTAAASPTN